MMTQDHIVAFFRSPLGAFGASVLILVASLLNFLSHNAYPILSWEAAIVIAAIVLLAGVVTLAFRLSGRLLRHAWYVLLLVVAVDLNFDTNWLIIVPVVVYLVLRELTIPIASAIALTVVASSVFFDISDPSAPEARTARNDVAAPETATFNAPTIVHIILDEHIGAAGLFDDDPKTVSTRQYLTDFYVTHGFRLFEKAYSRHFRTVNSLPEMLNLGSKVEMPENRSSFRSVEKNPYFTQLREKGYELSIYQTSYLDFCGTVEVKRCHTVAHTGLDALSRTNLPANEKAVIIGYNFLNFSETLTSLAVTYDTLAIVAGNRMGRHLPLLQIERRSRAWTLSAIDSFDALISDLKNAGMGQAYFLHALIPHYPFIYDEKCRLKPVPAWRTRRIPNTTLDFEESGYLEQVRCATAKVNEVLDALDGAAAVTGSVVIVQGDHGSRITLHEPKAEDIDLLDERDLIAGFATLFAVRADGIDAGVESSPVAIQALFPALWRSEFRSFQDAIEADTHEIILEGEGWDPVKAYPLPKSWTGDSPD